MINVKYVNSWVIANVEIGVSTKKKHKTKGMRNENLMGLMWIGDVGSWNVGWMVDGSGSLILGTKLES